jgi:hypothetical protein
MVELIQDIKPTIVSAYVNAPFDQSKEMLVKADYEIITAEQNAGLRMQYGKDAFVSKNGNYVKEGCVYVPSKGRFITRGSLVMASPNQATESHRNRNEFYVSQEQIDSVIGNSVQVPFEQSVIPTNRFGKDPVTVFLFGQSAQKYGEFLMEAKIDNMPLYFNDKNYVDSKDKPFANQLWLSRLALNSAVYGNLIAGYLGYSSTVRGVKLSAEGATPKNAEKTYTLNQILTTLKAGNLSGLESMVTTLFKANN